MWKQVKKIIFRI